MLDKQSTLLRNWIKVSPINVESFLEMAIMLTEMVYKYHQTNEIIGILNPDNIMIDSKSNRAMVTDTEEWNDAYRAPEYIGAFIRNPDSRSDLYALGVIFFELLTGKIPFQLSPQEHDWSYIHYVESPQSLVSQSQKIPILIQEIVKKLLQKSPDERYQSSLGLLADIKRCSKCLVENSEIKELEIGIIDQKIQFIYPDRLVGREKIVTQLSQYYEECQAGISRFVHIQGAEGVGKTSLIQAYMRELSANSDTQIMTASCQSENSKPYGMIVELIENGFDRLWSEAYSDINHVRDKLERELGEDISYLWALFPEATEQLRLFPGQDCQEYIEEELTVNILLIVLRTLIENDKSVLFFLDQLEYADVQSLVLLQKLASRNNHFSILCIAASRFPYENKYLSEYVVCQALLIEQIELESLKYDDVREILVSIISEDSMRVRVLARILLDYSGGNPLMIRETLNQWKLKRKIVFSEKDYRWTWEKLLIENSIDPIIDTQKLYEKGFLCLSSLTQQALVVAATIGVKFNSTLLAEIIGKSQDLTISILKEAEREGIIIREDTHSGIDAEVIFLFINKGLQQKIYEFSSAITEQYHYRIGRYYQVFIHKKLGKQEELEQLIVYHWNNCRGNLSNKQKYELCDLMLHMIKQFNITREHSEAKDLALVSIQLLEELQESMLKSASHYIELAYSEYMLGNTDQSQYYFNHLMNHAHMMNRNERIIFGTYQLEMFAFVDNEEAIRNGNNVLKEYGWEVPTETKISTLILEIYRTKRLLYKVRLNKSTPFINNDHDYMRFCKIVIHLSITLLFADPMRAILLLSRFIRYGMKQGSNEYVLIAVGLFELMLIRSTPSFMNKMSKNAYEKLTKTVDINSITNYRLHFMNGLYKQLEGPEELTGNVMKSIRRAIEAGSMTDANLAMIVLLASYYGDLYKLKDIHTYLQQEVSLYVDEKTVGYLDYSIHYYKAMQDHTSLELFAKKGIEETNLVKDSSVCLNKLEASFLAAKYEEAMTWALRGKELSNRYDWLPYRRIRIFEALTYSAMYREANEMKQNELKKKFIEIYKEMKKWSDFFGENSSCYKLISAEWYQMNGSNKAAIQYYERAIQKANVEQYYLIEAIASERLYHLYTLMNRKHRAGIALIDAYSGYSKWGVIAKVNQIKARNPQLVMFSTLLSSEEHEVSEYLHQETESELLTTKGYIQPDNEQVFLSQMFHWDFVAQSDQNISRFLELALSQLGGDRGYLISCDKQKYEMELQVGRQIEQQKIPQYICRYVNITGKPLILNDVMRTHYVKDSYIQTVQPGSVICIKLGMQQDNKSYLIYIENSLITNMFTERSLHILDMMVTKLTYIHWIKNEKIKNVSKGNIDKNQPHITNIEQNIIEPLTQREHEVLAALIEGLSNKEIGESLGISLGTVKTHLVNIYGKLGVMRRGQAIAKAKELNYDVVVRTKRTSSL